MLVVPASTGNVWRVAGNLEGDGGGVPGEVAGGNM